MSTSKSEGVFYTSPTQTKYKEDDMVKYIQKYGGFVDFNFSVGMLNGRQFQTALPKEDIKLLLQNEKIYEASEAFIGQKGGGLVPAAIKINDQTLNLLKNVAESGRDFMKRGWGNVPDPEIAETIIRPLNELRDFLNANEDQKKKVDKVAECLDYGFARGSGFSADIDNQLEEGKCSGGFIPKLSEIIAIVESVKPFVEFQKDMANAMEPVEPTAPKPVGVGAEQRAELANLRQNSVKNEEKSPSGPRPGYGGGGDDQ